MNIGILIPTLDGGGAERVAVQVGNYYVDKGNTVFYFLSSNSKKSVYDVKGLVIRTNIFEGSQNFHELIIKSLSMRKYKKKYNIECAISFMEEFNYINVLSKGKEMVITRICSIISQRDEWKNLFLYQKPLVAFLYRRADKIVVMTRYAKREMVTEYRIPNKKVVIIHNPVRKINNIATDKWVYGNNTVINVGRLIDFKQQNVAIRAFSEVVKVIPNAKLLLIGDGDNYSKLKKMISVFNLEENVLLLGFKKNIDYYLMNGTIFLMTSKTEGFPNAMLEAMQAGLPVISTRYSASEEILMSKFELNNEKCEYTEVGVIAPHIHNQYTWNHQITGEEILLAKTIIELLQKSELREKYAIASKKRVSSMNIEDVMKKWNHIIGGKIDE